MVKRKYLAIAFIAIISITMLIQLPATKAEETPELPGLTNWIIELPTYTPGPGNPAIVFPGDSFKVVFRETYQPNVVNGGYIYMIKYVDNKLKLYNYTVSVTQADSREFNVTIPTEIVDGLYDLVLYGDREYFIPRSVWVIYNISEVLNFIHISDLHYGAGTPTPTIGGYKRFAGLMLIQLLNPDFVVHTGDDVDTASSQQYVESRAFRYTFLYPYPMLLNPGNHDHPLTSYTTYYGSGTWYRLFGDKILWIAINTCEDGSPDWDQMVRVQSILEEYRGIPIKVIQMHHPVFYWQGEIIGTYNSSFLDDPNKDPNSPISYYWATNLSMAHYFLKLCEDFNISLVLAGHIHRDQYVVFRSNRTNTATYFVTTTTLAHGTGTYNGLQYIRLNTTSFNLTFPYAPSSFAGFSNIDRNSVRNSIPNTDPYYYGEYSVQKHAYVFKIHNSLYLNLSNTVLIALPWAGDISGFYVERSGNASAYVVDKKIINNILYIALHIDLPKDSELLMVFYNKEDNNPPEITLKLMMPDPPRLGKTNKIFFDIVDNEWGVRYVSAKIIYMGMEFKANLQYQGGNTYMVVLSGYTGDQPKDITILFNITDIAGNNVLKNFTVTLYPEGWIPPTSTTTTLLTTYTPTTTSPQTSTPQTSFTEQTTLPETTSASTTSPYSPQLPSPPGEEGGYIPVVIIVSIIIVVILALSIVFILKK